MRTFLTAALVTAAVYFGVTAYAGYRVGSAIFEAEKNPLIAMGARMVGRDQLERFAVKKSKLPPYVTDSPAFWVALRATE